MSTADTLREHREEYDGYAGIHQGCSCGWKGIGTYESFLTDNIDYTEHLAAILDAEDAQGSEAEVELASDRADSEHGATLIRHGDHWARFECYDLSIESTDVPAVIEQGLAHLMEED